jgi:hypothetical protein
MLIAKIAVKCTLSKRQPRTAGSARAGVSTRDPSAPLRSVLASPFDRWGSVLHPTPRHRCDGTRAPRGTADVASVIRLGPSRLGARARGRGPRRAWRNACGRVGPSRAARGDRTALGGDGACARRGGAGAFPATLARGLPLAPGLKPRSSPSRTERLQPRSRTFRGFRRFDFAFRLPFFRPWGTLQRGWCVFAFDARAACARVCVHDGASSLSRHLLSFGRFMRSSSACTPTARRESTHSTRASSREPRHASLVYASVVTSVVTSVARVLGALSASARLRLS